MESSKPRTIRGKILTIFILTVIPFMMISALISTYSIETSNERGGSVVHYSFRNA